MKLKKSKPLQKVLPVKTDEPKKRKPLVSSSRELQVAPSAFGDEDEDDGVGNEVTRLTRKKNLPPIKGNRRARDEDPDEGSIEDDKPSNVRLLPGVTKSTLRRINTMFGQRSDRIIDMLEANDTDPAAALITRTLLQTLVDVLPVVERGVRTSKGSRGVMPLNQCISQIREILHDLQAYKDRSALGQTIVDRNIRPAYLDLAVQVSNLFVEQENYVRTRIGKDDFEKFQEFNNQMKRSIADFIRKQYEEVSSSIIQSV